jgi:hypothetical protein
MKYLILLLTMSCTLIRPPKIYPHATDAHMHIHTPMGDDDLQFTAERALFAALTAEMRRAIVLSSGYQPGMTLEKARAENDFVATEVAKLPTRLAGACAVNPLQAWATTEIKRCHERGLKVLKLHTMASGMSLKDAAHVQKLREVLGLANELKMTVLVHGNYPESQRGDEGKILLSELQAFQQARFILGHLWGREFRWLKDFKHPRFLVEVSVAPIWMKEASMREELVKTMRIVGMEKFVFGSDWPVFHPAEMMMALKALPLADSEYQQVMFENASNLDDLFMFTPSR